jgi:hypothetical protein
MVMPAQSLAFPDNHFTHSFTNFAFHSLDDNDGAAKQVYRTLRLGGIAAATIWVDMPHANALEYAHFATRGEDASPPFLLSQLWHKEEHLRKALETAGFDPKKMKFHEKEAFLKISDLRRWTQLAWSYLGKPAGGWTPQDEEKQDVTIDVIVRQLKSERGFSMNEKGQSVLRMVACIGIATKRVWRVIWCSLQNSYSQQASAGLNRIRFMIGKDVGMYWALNQSKSLVLPGVR